MKNIILTATLVAILTGCAATGSHELVDNRYKKQTEITNYDLKNVLNKMSYEEEFSGSSFLNDNFNIHNIVNTGYTEGSPFFKACKKISKKTSQNNKYQYVETDTYIYFTQKARVDYCKLVRSDKQKELLETLNLKYIEEVDKSNEKHKTEYLKFENNVNKECDLRLENSRNEYVQLKEDLQIPNIKPFNLKFFYDIKVLKDNDTNKLSMILTDKLDPNYKTILHEKAEICELTARSRPEIMAKNEEVIKMEKAYSSSLERNASGYVIDKNRPKGLAGCLYDADRGNMNLACMDTIKIHSEAQKEALEFENNMLKFKTAK